MSCLAAPVAAAAVVAAGVAAVLLLLLSLSFRFAECFCADFALILNVFCFCTVYFYTLYGYKVLPVMAQCCATCDNSLTFHLVKVST